MLSPTILSINWFFSFILLRYLDGIQRNSQASIFETQWFNEFSLFFWAKNERVCLLNDINLLRLHRNIRDSGCFSLRWWFVANNRIRRRTLRPESLDWYAARDSERVVRTYQEMDVGPVSPSSTTKDANNHKLRHLLRAQNYHIW